MSAVNQDAQEGVGLMVIGWGRELLGGRGALIPIPPMPGKLPRILKGQRDATAVNP